MIKGDAVNIPEEGKALMRKTMTDSATQSLAEEDDYPVPSEQVKSPIMINVPSTKVVLQNSIASLPQSPMAERSPKTARKEKKAMPFKTDYYNEHLVDQVADMLQQTSDLHMDSDDMLTTKMKTKQSQQ